MEASEYDISFVPQNNVKSQTLEDFFVEFTMTVKVESPFLWFLLVDGSSNLKRIGAGIMLEGPGEVLWEQALCLNVQDRNNQTEYKALIIEVKLTCEVGAIHLQTRSNSQLVNNQRSGDYQMKEPLLF